MVRWRKWLACLLVPFSGLPSQAPNQAQNKNEINQKHKRKVTF